MSGVCVWPWLGASTAEFNSELLSHMPSLSNLTTKQWGKIDKDAIHKLVICAGIPRDAVEAAISKHDCGQQQDGRMRGGEVGNTTGSACSMATTMTTNTTRTTN
jgi:hypothetical protein